MNLSGEGTMVRKSWRLLVPIIFPLLAASAMVAALNAEFLMMGRRLDDPCAEHDTFLAYTLQKAPSDLLGPGWVGDYDYGIIATHPVTVVPAHGLTPTQENWCGANWEGCPEVSSQCSEMTPTNEPTSQKIYDDGTWVINVREVDDMPEMAVSVTDTVYSGNAIALNRRYSPTAGSWPEVFVLYANGFARIKPLARTVERAKNGLPCFGTSAVLGPFQFAPPLLESAPHPELHPVVDQVDIHLTSPEDVPLLALMGRFVNISETTLINATWLISVTEVSTVETQLDVCQHIRLSETVPLRTVCGTGVLGITSLSSMWADTDTHDADVLRIANNSGVVYEVSASDIDISGMDYGETPAISATTGYTLSLITTSPTDHNVGAPDVHIHLEQASFFFRLYLPLIVKQ